MKCPKWFKPEISLGSLLVSIGGGIMAYVVIPWAKWTTISIFALQADIGEIKRAVVPPDPAAFPINEQFKNVVKKE